MSLRLALLRSLEGIETSNDDDNVKKNEEKSKSFSQSQTCTKSIQIPPTDLYPRVNREYQAFEESVQKEVVIHSSTSNKKKQDIADDSTSIITSDCHSDISPLSNEVRSRILQLRSSPHQDRKVSTMKRRSCNQSLGGSSKGYT